MTTESKRQRLTMISFMIDEKPHAFIFDADANRRFLESIDPAYWRYQALAHVPGLESGDPEDRKRAAVALRIAYSQGLETLFAIVAALLQCPTYPIGWLSKYSNRDLRSVVRKVNAHREFPCFLRSEVSWHAIAAIVFEGIGQPKEDELIEDFGKLWKRLAREFAEDDFEPEYNSLKHGMRSLVGGFSVSVGIQDSPGVPASKERMRPVGGAEYGSTFWMPPHRLEGCKFTYELSHNLSRGWSPTRFTNALPLIALSIGNVAARALLCAGVEPTKAPFNFPLERADFDAPWKELPTIGRMSFGERTTDVRNWREPTKEEILTMYPRRQRTGGA